jgi:hypothetical protein
VFLISILLWNNARWGMKTPSPDDTQQGKGSVPIHRVVCQVGLQDFDNIVSLFGKAYSRIYAICGSASISDKRIKGSCLRTFMMGRDRLEL